MKEARLKPAVLQMEYHPYAQRLDIRKKAKDNGIQVECWFPSGGAMSNGALLKGPTIMKIAEAHGKSAAQVYSTLAYTGRILRHSRCHQSRLYKGEHTDIRFRADR